MARPRTRSGRSTSGSRTTIEGGARPRRQRGGPCPAPGRHARGTGPSVPPEREEPPCPRSSPEPSRSALPAVRPPCWCCTASPAPPYSMRPLAEAFARSLASPSSCRCCPATGPQHRGHGSSDRVPATGLARPRRPTPRSVRPLRGGSLSSGLSMGEAFTAWLASEHPEIAGIAPASTPSSPRWAGRRGLPRPTSMEWPSRARRSHAPGIGSDIAKEGVNRSRHADMPSQSTCCYVQLRRCRRSWSPPAPTSPVRTPLMV